MSEHFEITGQGLHIGRAQEGAADPNGLITAEIIGEFFWDTVNKKIYLANALTDSDWIDPIALGGFGNVKTVDDLLSTQLVLGDGESSIVTEPDLKYNGSVFEVLGVGGIEVNLVTVNPTGPSSTLSGSSLDLGEGGGFSIESTPVISWNSGNIALQNIDVLDNITKATILAIPGIVNTPDTLIENRLLTGNGGSQILTESELFYNGIEMGLGIILPLSKFHMYEDTSFSGGSEGLTIEQDGSGDAKIHLLLTGGTRFALGIDNNDGDKFKISDTPNFGVSDIAFTIVPVSMLVGIGQPDPLTRLHVATDAGDSLAITTFESTAMNAAATRNFVGTRNPEGLITANPGDHYHRANGIDSNDFIFKNAASGNSGWRESVTTPDALLRSGNVSGFALNQLKLSLDEGLLFTHAIKTRHDEFDQFKNAIDFFLWDADEDNPTDVGTLPVLTLKGDGKVGVMRPDPVAVFDILSLFGDTTPVIAMESASNAGSVRVRVGNRNPEGTVNGIGPDLYFRDEGVLSAIYENRNASSANSWLRHSVYPSDIIELNSSAELDALASGGIITISANTTWVIKAPLTTANRIVVDNASAFLNITGEFNATASITYTGTDTFITSIGAIRIFAQVSLISSSTGTFIDQNGGSGLSFKESSLVGWDDLGAIINAPFFASQSRFVNIGSGLTLTNNNICTIGTLVFAGAALNGPFFTINTNNPFSLYSFTDITLFALGATGSLLDLDTRLNTNAIITITRTAIPTGNLFKPSVLTDATINSVADGSPTTGTITEMADNGSGGTTISSTTTYFEDEEVTQTGTTNYNGTFQIFNVVAGVSYDIIAPFTVDDATGSVDSVRLTLSLAGGHGISTGDSIKVIDTNFYNGFATTLNVVSDDITINGVFISTNTGSIERELSVDQTDRRVNSFDNQKASNSHTIACAHVNDNSTANGAIVNNTFTDIVFGTVGAALIASSTMELWRMVDEINGIFEYFGVEEFDGLITFDFTVESSGGTVDFRFKWQKDTGSGFADLDDNVESLVAVGSDAQSVTKTFPLRAQFGDRIRPQITRNSGSSGITTTYATIYAT